MSADPTIRNFLRAGTQRLTAGRFLAQGGFCLDAIYLAGYGPELALKALILAHTPVSQRQEKTQSFHGQAGHDYGHLRQLLTDAGRAIPKEIAAHLERVNSWRNQLRYSTETRSLQDAKGFLIAAQAILDWADRSIG